MPGRPARLWVNPSNLGCVDAWSSGRDPRELFKQMGRRGMLDLDAARARIEENLQCYGREWRTPAIVVTGETVEYEWGWQFVCAPEDPKKVPGHRNKWLRRYLLVDRVTGNVGFVGSSGVRIAIMKLLGRRIDPAAGHLPGMTERPVGGGLAEVTFSTRLFRSLRELEAMGPDGGEFSEISILKRSRGDGE